MTREKLICIPDPVILGYTDNLWCQSTRGVNCLRNGWCGTICHKHAQTLSESLDGINTGYPLRALYTNESTDQK